METLGGCWQAAVEPNNTLGALELGQYLDDTLELGQYLDDTLELGQEM